ncbi:MAG: D-arabinono-1,4-lactone oxidase [Pseudomonadota bacterium]
MSWSNWSGRHHTNTASLAFVRSEEDACAQVQAARDAGQRLRVAGAGHSHYPLVPTDGRVLDLSGLSGVVSVDAERQRAWVWAGTPIYALGNALHREGLALHNQGDIDRQAIAGAVATGTHGTGLALGNLATAVTGLRLINGDGQLETLPNAGAARISLGAFGVVTQLELALRPRYRLAEHAYEATLEEVLSQADELAERHRHFEFFWYPQNDRAIVKTIDETDEHARYPLAAEGQRRAYSHEVLPNHRPKRHTEMEYAVPRREAIACMRELAALVQRDFPQVRWPLEFRTVAQDDVWLSQAYEQDVVTLSVHEGIDTDETAYFRASESLFRGVGGRPHWGKVHYLSGNELAAIHPRWNDWWAARERFDPRGTFLNDHLARWRPSTTSVTSSTA